MQKRQLLHIALSVLIISVWGVLMVLFASYFTNREVDKAKSNPEKVSVSDNMKLLDSGTFQMGSPETERQREENEVLHEVKIDSFYISPLEVTQKEYEELMGKNPSEFHGENLPIENVSWFDAVEYCNKLSEKNALTPAYRVNGKEVEWDQNANGYRLPTEAEWEYACRANTTTPFNTETSISDQESNYYGHYPYLIEENYFSQGNLDTEPGQYRETSISVGSFQPNAWGLYDMHGNVGEWCWDFYGAYDQKNIENPTGPATGNARIVRGGGWNDYAKHLRSAYRSSKDPNTSASNVGFRLARNAASTTEKSIIVNDIEAVDKHDIRGDKTLIVYFSWGGNTEGIAEQIQEKTGADMFELTLVNPYSSDYNTVLDEAQRDMNANARPELKNYVEDISKYDAILIGYPNWWATIPMPVASFLEEYDLSNKRIVPFCSHGGGRLGQSVNDIRKLAPNSVIGEALSVHYSGDSGLSDDISQWLAQNHILEQ